MNNAKMMWLLVLSHPGFVFSKIPFIIYLAALDLSCGTQDLLCLLQHVGSLVVAYGI